MAFAFHHSTPATGAEAYFNLKELLKTQGWTVLSSGDSITYFPASDGITHGGAGAGGLANTKAWFRIQDPAAAKELTIQRGTTNLVYRVKFSPSGGFIGGAPGIATTPSAVIEAIVKGAGTDAAPTYGTLLGADGAYRFNAASDDAAPYAFWATSFPTGGGAVNGALVFEGLGDTAPGEAEDTAILAGTSLTAASVGQDAGNGFSSYLPTAGVPATWQTYAGMIYATSSPVAVFPAAAVVNPITGKDEILPILLMRRSAIANPGYKGRLAMTKWAGPIRATGDTLSAAGARDYIVQSDVILPWDGSVPTV